MQNFSEGVIAHLKSEGEGIRQGNTAFVRCDHRRKPVKRKVTKGKVKMNKKKKNLILLNSTKEERILTHRNRAVESGNENLLGRTPMSYDFCTQTADISSIVQIIPDNACNAKTTESLSGGTLKGDKRLSSSDHESSNDFSLYGAVESEPYSKLASELQKLTVDLNTQLKDSVFYEENGNEYY